MEMIVDLDIIRKEAKKEVFDDIEDWFEKMPLLSTFAHGLNETNLKKSFKELKKRHLSKPSLIEN